jgi:hypothetical protein
MQEWDYADVAGEMQDRTEPPPAFEAEKAPRPLGSGLDRRRAGVA